MQDETTTKFIGNIVFNDGEKDILVSDLASVEEVNEALSDCVTNDKVDTYTKMWMSTEPTQPFYLNPDFDYKDDHVISSKAVKELIVENNSSAIAEYVVSLNESLTTTLNDYGTKEWINNIIVPQHKVINDNSTALYPIVKHVGAIMKLATVSYGKPPQKLKIETNETYNGIYEYTEEYLSRYYYGNEHATENNYKIYIKPGLIDNSIVVVDLNNKAIDYLDVYKDVLFIQYEETDELIPLTLQSYNKTYKANYSYPSLLHVFDKHIGVYELYDMYGDYFRCRNDSNITLYLNRVDLVTRTFTMDKMEYFLNESTGEVEYFTDDDVNYIYFEKTIVAADKSNYIPTVNYVENQHVQTLLDQIKSLEERIQALESLT